MARQKFGRIGFLIATLSLMLMLALRPALASTGSYTQESAVAYARSLVGTPWNVDRQGYDCVDIIKMYFREIGGMEYMDQGNAGVYATTAVIPDGWTREYMSAGYEPQPGDVACWGFDAYQWNYQVRTGHVGVVVAVSGNTITLVDQDSNTQRAADYSDYRASDVTCYIHPDWRHAPGWANENGGYYYYENDGTLRKNAWIEANGTCYYLGADGKLVTNGWAVYNNKYFYMGSNGRAVRSQWVTYEGKHYYIGSLGSPLSNTWVKSGGKYYYLDASGNPVVNGWVKYRGNYYYMNANGNPVTNDWVQYNGTWYHLNGVGVCDKTATAIAVLTQLLATVQKKSGLPLCAYAYEDFDGNGANELFVVVGNETDMGVQNGELWFASSNGTISLVSDAFSGYLFYGGTLRSGVRTFLSITTNTSSSWSIGANVAHIYTVRNGKSAKVSMDGSFISVSGSDNGMLVGMKSTFQQYELSYNEASNALEVVRAI